MRRKERNIQSLFQSRGCDYQHKRAYNSWRSADAAAREYQRRHGTQTFPYKCLGCRRWHLTRKLYEQSRR